jgi:hypothetical protein
MTTPTAEIANYLFEVDKLYRAGNATEHSYRPVLKTLFEKITTGLTTTNESKHIACGAPDYIGGYQPVEKWLKDRKGSSFIIRGYSALPENYNCSKDDYKITGADRHRGTKCLMYLFYFAENVIYLFFMR